MDTAKSSLLAVNKIQPEIQSTNHKPEKFCSYPHRHCLTYPIKGYDYCIQHILEDKTAPYKGCCFVHHKTGRRCPNAAPKSDKKDGYCQEHKKKIGILRKQASKNKRKSTDSIESIMYDIERNNEEMKKAEVAATKATKTISNLHFTDVCQSDSDSDKEPIPIEDIFRGDCDSDPESLDSDQEDPLRYAGVFSTEEAALILRDKLIRLQSLYIGQFKRLQHVLRERRRRYLKNVKQERELYGSISGMPKPGSEVKTYNKLRALNKYHCKRGQEALMQQQNKEKRLALTEGASYKPPTAPKCIHLEDSIRCINSPVPFSKHCLKHILHDSHQILFKPCHYGDTGCNRVIVPVQDDSKCVLHACLSDSIEPLVKNLPQETSVSPKGYPAMMSDIDKFLGNPDQFLSSLSTSFSENDSINVSTSSDWQQQPQTFDNPSMPSPYPTMNCANLPAVHNKTSPGLDFKSRTISSHTENKAFIKLDQTDDTQVLNINVKVSDSPNKPELVQIPFTDFVPIPSKPEPVQSKKQPTEFATAASKPEPTQDDVKETVSHPEKSNSTQNQVKEPVPESVKPEICPTVDESTAKKYESLKTDDSTPQKMES